MSALLPRLRRLALVLAGDEAGGDVLLRLACDAMLTEPSRRPTNMPIDRWALSQVYAMWLDETRGRREAAQPPADQELMRTTFAAWGVDDVDASELAGFLAGLPPQQRAVALLVYGEGMTYEQASMVLDASKEKVASRATGALAGLVERLGLQPPEPPPDMDDEPHCGAQEQAVS